MYVIILVFSGQIIRGKIVRENFTIPKEFEVSFDLYMNSKRNDTSDGHRKIFRMSNTTDYIGNHGDRIFMLSAVNKEENDNTLQFLSSVGDDPSYAYKTDDSMPIQEWINITVKQANVSGIYKLQVFINKSLVHEVENPSPYVYENVTAYASETFSRPIDGFLTNLKIFPGEQNNNMF